MYYSLVINIRSLGKGENMEKQLAKEYFVIYLPFFKWEVSIEFDTDYFPFLKNVKH